MAESSGLNKDLQGVKSKTVSPELTSGGKPNGARRSVVSNIKGTTMSNDSEDKGGDKKEGGKMIASGSQYTD